MNNTIYYDAMMTDDERRQKLYDDQLFDYSPRSSTLAFCKFAKELIEEAFNRYTSSPSQTDPPSFSHLDPLTAQYALSVEDYAAILTQLKPEFIHHPESKRHLQNIVDEFGCDLPNSAASYSDHRTLSYVSSFIA